MGRVYAIEDSDGLTLIDAGIASSVKRIVRELKTIGRAPTDIVRIIVTHAHIDHIGGLPRLQELSGAKVLCSRVEAPFVEGKSYPPLPKRKDIKGISKLLPMKPWKSSGTPVAETVSSWETLPMVMGGLVVIDTPGHSPGAISLWQPEWKVLFCGDVLMNTPKLRLPIAAFTSDMRENIRSVQRLAELGPSLVCFGHGQPLLVDATQKLRAFAREVQR